MSDEDLKKILFSLYVLRNRVEHDNKNWEIAQEAIYMIEHHFGIDLAKENQK